MEEPASFNELFSVTKSQDFRICEFREDDAGFFYARWRCGDISGETVKRRLPFNAMLDGFLSCKIAAAEETTGGESDLFG